MDAKPKELIERLQEIRRAAVEAIDRAGSSLEVEAARLEHLGRKSAHAEIVRALGGFPEDVRREVGHAANEARSAIEESLARRLDALAGAERDSKLQSERLDPTLPGRALAYGGIHPLTQVLEEIVDVFVGLGFNVVEGPDIETDHYNFAALNFPPDHPSRNSYDSFFIQQEGEQPLFRTHTSPVQIRVMEATPPPVYVVIPGRCARRDPPDPKRLPVFTQIEGLAVDDGITFADMKGTLEAFAKAMFGREQRVKLLPHFFPFTEPSADVSVICFVCGGSGCFTCRGEGWIEIMGAGMVHPNVFRASGYDPESTGFAFGMGVERVAMLRHGVADIRWFFENDISFLKAF